MEYKNLKEEPLKSAVQQDYFKSYKYTQIGNIDFVIAKYNTEKAGQRSLFQDVSHEDLKSILWAEAKQGTKHDIFESFVQLILTIGKERTFEKYLPPKYIGAFDAEKIAFIEYHAVQQVFYQNDFNWNVTPSNHETKEFKQLYELCKKNLEQNSILFEYQKNQTELKEFIKLNFKTTSEITEKIAVTKNNFTFVFQKWSESVKPSIAIDWNKINKSGIISADFFLADLLSSNGEALKDNLYVVLKKTKYELDRKIDDMGFETSKTIGFNDKQKAYNQFWAIYERPPKEEYWDYIIARRDLLVPQDIRERKGSFFTPQIWVEKSQEYLASVLGENWQSEYFIWDCCAGTGNLLNGLSNYDNVWASTLDQQDVDVMKDRVNNGWNMPIDHIFKFDFLNDDFTQCPEPLQKILNDEEKRKKLVIYINPPYAEADNRKGTGRSGVAISKIQEKYSDFMGYAKREIYIQFLTRIYKEIPDCKLGLFSTLKTLSAPKFSNFRKSFNVKLEKLFIVPADTFDNVKGQFPIGFHIWDLSENEIFKEINASVFERNGEKLPDKKIFAYENEKFINDWTLSFIDEEAENEKTKKSIGNIIGVANDFQHLNTVCIERPNKPWNHQYQWQISSKNLIESSIYFSVRLCIDATWQNDRDQFLFPNDKWQDDKEFQSNCLIYTLFHGQNRITCTDGTNHFIPFTREQVGCKSSFESNFMSKFLSDFLGGKIVSKKIDGSLPFDEEQSEDAKSFTLSPQAQEVYNAGLELYKYYHAQSNANANASFYDIRKYFQGTNDSGKMNTTSDDETYTALIATLRQKMKTLAKQIEAKVYEYGFLK